MSLIGIIVGLLLFDQPIDVMVMVGLILLAGVVVNNAIVLIDFIQLTIERGSSRIEAVVESCRTRLTNTNDNNDNSIRNVTTIFRNRGRF